MTWRFCWCRGESGREKGGFCELACQRHVRPHPILHHVPIDAGMFFPLLLFSSSLGQRLLCSKPLAERVGGVVSVRGIHSLKSHAGGNGLKNPKRTLKNDMMPA